MANEPEKRRWRLMTQEDYDRMGRLLASGKSVAQVAGELDRSPTVVRQFIKQCGGVIRPSKPGTGRHLSMPEREEISRGLAEGLSARAIARRIGRQASTVTREIHRGGGPGCYRAYAGEVAAQLRRRRPRQGKLVTCTALRREVEAGMAKEWSPEQIAKRLREDYPDNPEMRVSHETIYQALFVQSKGTLKVDVAKCLRSGRAVRRPQGRAEQRGRIKDMVMISERPAEVEDRAVPGHWEGDLVLGKANQSAIATLVERSTRWVMLVALPGGHTAVTVAEALAKKIQTLPEALRRSLTWDQGPEMADHRLFSVATNVAVFFCDPHAPWQRGTNENTNGLLRQYFPKSTDLSIHSQEELDEIAAKLNDRPRKTLGWRKPSEKMSELVATTA